ncbi:M23 family metallopeptidase [Sphingobacterium bovistauri]|uniref:M23 family metallopeptidase n=1 Tax=Sphingobacterium bovistauri TaxID=2781959 RepID=A0ABS7Z1I3_9SPHI|nr:M23 family metallopeptidase [Sphingobacterium bovistauri]MCA5004035.1 M23 family metallopeptidase [Sphingobacterium bovistauri]
MLIVLFNYLQKRRGMYPALITIGIYLLIFPKIHLAQQLQMSSPLPQLKVTSPYGKRIHPILGVLKFHNGVDFKSRADTVKSILDGQVIEARYNRLLGNYITIKNGAIEIIYGHLNYIYVQKDDYLSAGDNIGISGKTGLATAEHLHLAIRMNNQYINPIKFLIALQTRMLNNSK